MMRSYLLGPEGIPGIARRVTEDLQLPTKLDAAVTLSPFYINKLKTGKKTHTIKFHRQDIEGILSDVIRLPKDAHLPLNESGTSTVQVGTMYFDEIGVLQFRELTRKLAIGDGDSGLKVFKEGARSLAKSRKFDLLPETWGSLYNIEDIAWL